MAEINANFGDREMMDDTLSTQKSLAGLYNTTAGECVGAGLMNDMLTILGEEHKLQLEVFQEMSKRGWYDPAAAEQQKIDQARQKYQNGNS